MTSTTQHDNDLALLHEKIRSLREDQHHLDWRIRFEEELLDNAKFEKMLEEQRAKIAAAFDYLHHLELERRKAPQMIDHLKLTKELKEQEIFGIHCKIELIKGASSTPRTSKAKTEKVLTAGEKYQAFLRLIPEAIQKELGAEKLASLYEASR
jgi:hypothetical protein